MKRKTIQLPPKAPREAMRIEMRDGAAHYICANGVPEQDASDLVQWARNLVEAWEMQQHVCRNCVHSEIEDYMIFCKKKNGDYVGNEHEENVGKDCRDFIHDDDLED